MNHLNNMYCKCISNERIDKAFIVGNLYQYTMNDKDQVTVFDPYTNMSTGLIEPHTIPVDNFVLSFQALD